MTRLFDQAAREYLSGGLWGEPQVPVELRPRDLRVRPMSVRAARPFIATYHYSQTMPDATREVFAGYYPGNILAGFVVFGMGAGKGQYTRLLPDLADGEYRELSRLWSPDGMPKNTESRLISSAIRQLSGVRLVISYADPSQGHRGSVYQATNFIYLGRTDGGERLVDEDGQEVHSKLLSVYRMRHPRMATWTSREIAQELRLRAIPNPSKHRYAYATTRKDRAWLETMALPYPAVTASSDAPGVQSGEGGSQPTSPLHPLDERANDYIVVAHPDGQVIEPAVPPEASDYVPVVSPGQREPVTRIGQGVPYRVGDSDTALSFAPPHRRSIA